MNEDHLCVLTFIIGFVTGLLLALLGSEMVEVNWASRIHRAAIEAGAGEYYLDEKHEKQFRFIRAKDEGLK